MCPASEITITSIQRCTVRVDGRAHEHSPYLPPVGTTKTRKRRWHACRIEPPTAVCDDRDMFAYLDSGIALPEWFASGGLVGMEDLETERTESEGCRNDDAALTGFDGKQC